MTPPANRDAPLDETGLEAAAKALWRIGNQRIGPRVWESVAHHYTTEAAEAIRAYLASLGTQAPEPSAEAMQAAQWAFRDMCVRGDLRGAYGYVDIGEIVRAAYAVDVRGPSTPQTGAL